jgi:C4-dicarboxylate transporter DctQ subunit
MGVLQSLERVFDRTLTALVILASIILFLVTMSVCLEVVLRYFFNRPQVWVIELSEYSLLYITFLGAAWVLRGQGHISVDLLTGLLSQRGRSLCSFISYSVCLLVSLVLVIFGVRVSWNYFVKGLYNPTILEIPTAYILVIIPVGGLTLLVQAVRDGIHDLRVFKSKPANAEQSPGKPANTIE